MVWSLWWWKRCRSPWVERGWVLVPVGREYVGAGARWRDVSETVYCRNPLSVSKWSLSVPGGMFTLSVKPKGTLGSQPALLAAVFYVQAYAPKAGRLCSAGGFACSAHTCPTRWHLCAPPKSPPGWSPSHRAHVHCWWSEKLPQDPECKCRCKYSVVRG